MKYLIFSVPPSFGDVEVFSPLLRTLQGVLACGVLVFALAFLISTWRSSQ